MTIQTLPDGTLVAWLDGNFNPTTPEEATLVEITTPDGAKIFAHPVRKPTQEDSPDGLS